MGRQNHHRIPYEKENGLTVHEIADKSWSIMVLNKELETIYEVKMDPTTHTPYYLFPSPKGLWVLKRKEEDGPPLSMELVKPGFSL